MVISWAFLLTSSSGLWSSSPMLASRSEEFDPFFLFLRFVVINHTSRLASCHVRSSQKTGLGFFLLITRDWEPVGVIFFAERRARSISISGRPCFSKNEATNALTFSQELTTFVHLPHHLRHDFRPDRLDITSTWKHVCLLDSGQTVKIPYYRFITVFKIVKMNMRACSENFVKSCSAVAIFTAFESNHTASKGLSSF